MSGNPSLLSSFDHGSILFLFAATIGFLSHRYFHYRAARRRASRVARHHRGRRAVCAIRHHRSRASRPLPKAKADVLGGSGGLTPTILPLFQETRPDVVAALLRTLVMETDPPRLVRWAIFSLVGCLNRGGFRTIDNVVCFDWTAQSSLLYSNQTCALMN